MKKILLLACILLVNVAVFAQSETQAFFDKDPQKRAEARTHMLKEKLALSDAQYASVLKLNVKTATQMQPILFSGSKDWYDMAMKTMPIVKEQRKELALILTKEQNKELDKIKKDNRTKLLELLLAWQKD